MSISASSYTTFVQSRVKWLDSFSDDIHHACTGICGEAIEFAYANGKDNEKEEFGDLEFYVRHAWLAVGRWSVQFQSEYHPANLPAHPYDALVYVGGDLLDQSKKIWIYNKDPQSLCLYSALLKFEQIMDEVSKNLEYPRTQARKDNQAKLEKRYPAGYSDAAAQARADKTPQA